MGRMKGDSGAYEFTRAACDELSDAERQYRVGFAVALAMGDVRGIWRLRVEAIALERSALAPPIASWEGTWPNSVSQSFETFLYSACHRVVRMVEAWRIEQESREGTHSA